MRFRALAAAAAAALTSTANAGAQQVAVTPFVGYRVFGSLTDFTGATADVDAALSYGGMLTYFLQPNTGIEFAYSHQDTDVTLTQPFGGRSRADLKLDEWMIGGHRELVRPYSKVRPYVGAFLGLTRAYSSDGDGSDTRFMVGPDGGVRFSFGEGGRVGANLGARGYFTFAGDGSGSIFCGVGGCAVGFGSSVFFQMDLIAGLSVALGGGRQ